jgi:hypothetical protein
MRQPTVWVSIPWKFLLLLLGLSVPLWTASARASWFLAPGLPVSALMAVCPLAAAALLTGWNDGRPGVRELLRKPLDYWKVQHVRWVVLALALKPGVMVLSYALMRGAGMPIPVPHVTIGLAAAMFAAFFVAAAAEETGWTAYATDLMTRSCGAMQAGIAIGIAWAAWHIVPLRQANRSATWIAWHGLETVASRVLIVWLYSANERCVWLAVLYHAADNVSWLLFPQWGSYYAPEVTAPVTAAAALVAVRVRPPQAGQPRRGRLTCTKPFN